MAALKQRLSRFRAEAGNAPSQNKTASDQEATQVTLLSCYYVQQYYHPNHEQLVGEREATDVPRHTAGSSWFGRW